MRLKTKTINLLLAILFIGAAMGTSAYCVAQAQDKPKQSTGEQMAKATADLIDAKIEVAKAKEASVSLPKITNEERLELRDLILSGRLVSEQVDKMRAQITALQLQVEKAEPEVKKADDKFQAKWAELLKRYSQTPGETNVNLETGEFVKVPKQQAAKQ